MNNEFQLEQDRVPPPRGRFATSDRTRQQVLFSGLDCLPGQMDLFQTDGQSQVGEPNHGDEPDPNREGDVHD